MLSGVAALGTRHLDISSPPPRINAIVGKGFGHKASIGFLGVLSPPGKIFFFFSLVLIGSGDMVSPFLDKLSPFLWGKDDKLSLFPTDVNWYRCVRFRPPPVEIFTSPAFSICGKIR